MHAYINNLKYFYIYVEFNIYLFIVLFYNIKAYLYICLKI